MKIVEAFSLHNELVSKFKSIFSLLFLAISWLAAPEELAFLAVVYFDVVQGMLESWYGGVGWGGGVG